MDTELTQEVQIPAYKIYKDRVIYVSTFLGGPLVTGYMLAENFKAFGEPNKAKKAWIYSILTTILIFACIFSIPSIEKIPTQLIPLAYTAAAYSLTIHFQGVKIKEHIISGGLLYSWWRAIVISLIGLVIIVVPIAAVAYFTTPNIDAEMKAYGTMKNEMYFDKGAITETEVDKIAAALIQVGLFDEKNKRSFFVKSEGAKYIITLPVIDGFENNTNGLAQFEMIRVKLQGLLPGNTIILKLCSATNFNDIKKVLE